jgi:hypothetical protein
METCYGGAYLKSQLIWEAEIGGWSSVARPGKSKKPYLHASMLEAWFKWMP